MLDNEWPLDLDDVVNATIGMEDCFDFTEGGDGPISSAAAECASCIEGRRESDGIVERETEGLVHLLTAFTTIKQIFLDI